MYLVKFRFPSNRPSIIQLSNWILASITPHYNLPIPSCGILGRIPKSWGTDFWNSIPKMDHWSGFLGCRELMLLQICDTSQNSEW